MKNQQAQQAYTFLAIGATLQPGDQFYSACNNQWCDWTESVGEKLNRHDPMSRRPAGVPALPDFRWIPVTEKDPPNGHHWFMVLVEGWSRPGYGFWTMGRWSLENDPAAAGKGNKVTHWCPLPPAPPVETREDRQARKFRELSLQAYRAGGESRLAATEVAYLDRLVQAFKEALATQ